jgi:phosphate transport system protein
MSRIIDRGLEEESVLLAKMGEYTYETLSISIHGYLHGKSVQTEVKEMSDMLVAMANKVEDQTFQLIARFQPVASDLRAIKSYMKIGNDFARYGRYALDISTINDQLKGLTECETWTRDYIHEMSDKVLSMVKISIDALKKYDATLAKTITTTEREVDEMYLNYINKLSNAEITNSKCLLSSALVTRYLERIADHAVYICESIVYIATGEKLALS